MKLYILIGSHSGLLDHCKAYLDPEEARARAYDLAERWELTQEAPDDEPEWTPEAGVSRGHLHHWFNDEHDVWVEEIDSPE